MQSGKIQTLIQVLFKGVNICYITQYTGFELSLFI